MIYSNYEGGVLNVDVDADIPNLKIGISTYEPVTINFSGAFVGNITEVLFAGFNEPVAITGVPAGIVTVYAAELGDVAISPYLSEYEILGVPIANCMVGAEGCTDFATGGGNSSPQIVQFFLAEFGPGSVFYAHWTNYGVFPVSGFDVSDGGNCCLDTPLGDPNPIYVGGTEYNFLPDTILLCDDDLTLDISFYETLWGITTWSTGETGPDIVVDAPGVYSFTMWDYCHYDPSDLLTDTVVVIPCFTEVDASICDGASYTLPDGAVVTDAGVYTTTIAAVDGSDSVIVTTLTVHPVYAILMDTAICAGDVITLPDGTTTGTAGTYLFDLLTVAGCDSSITLVVTVGDVFATTVPAAICSGETYVLPDGTITATAGIYVQTLTTVSGCDSVITTILTVSPEYAITTDVAICAGESYVLPDGTSTTTPGTYVTSMLTVAGCDSVITTNLAVVTEITTLINAAICDGDIYTLPDGTLTVLPGIYNYTFISVGGCDSTVTVDLTVAPEFAVSTSVSICDGESYVLPDGTVVTTTGVYTTDLLTAAGCDSIITTFLNVQPVYTFIEDTTVCIGETVTLPDGAVVSVPGVYTVNFLTTAGCDSIFFYYVSNYPETEVAFTLPDVWCLESGALPLTADPPGGNFSGPGIAADTFDPAVAGGAGAYTITYIYVDINGCATVIAETITVEENFADAGADTLIYDSGVAELNGSTGGSYQWSPSDGLTCTDCPVTYSEVDQTTTYYLTSVSANGCLAIDSVTVFVQSSIEDVFIPNTFTPNSDGLNDMFTVLGPGISGILQAAVYDRWGERIWYTQNVSPNTVEASWDGTFKGETVIQGVYAYYFELQYFSGRVEQFSGNVTLIR